MRHASRQLGTCVLTKNASVENVDIIVQFDGVPLETDVSDVAIEATGDGDAEARGEGGEDDEGGEDGEDGEGGGEGRRSLVGPRALLGFVPAMSSPEVLAFADAYDDDAAKAMQELRRDRQIAVGVEFFHAMVCATGVTIPIGKEFHGAKGGGTRRDLQNLVKYLAGVQACDHCRNAGDEATNNCVKSRLCPDCVYAPEVVDDVCGHCSQLGHITADPVMRPCGRCVRAKRTCRRWRAHATCADGEHSSMTALVNKYVKAIHKQALLRDAASAAELHKLAASLDAMAPDAAAVIGATRPAALTDVIHSLRRIWGKYVDYTLVAGDELICSHFLLVLRAKTKKMLEHLPAAALRAKNRLATRHAVAICRRAVAEALVETGGMVVTLVPEVFFAFFRGLNPCANQIFNPTSM